MDSWTTICSTGGSSGSIPTTVWVPTVFTKNRDRLLAGDLAEAFLTEVLRLADGHGLLSHEHFTVDGTLLEAWASQKSFTPKAPSGPPAPSRTIPAIRVSTSG